MISEVEDQPEEYDPSTADHTKVGKMTTKIAELTLTDEEKALVQEALSGHSSDGLLETDSEARVHLDEGKESNDDTDDWNSCLADEFWPRSSISESSAPLADAMEVEVDASPHAATALPSPGPTPNSPSYPLSFGRVSGDARGNGVAVESGGLTHRRRPATPSHPPIVQLTTAKLRHRKKRSIDMVEQTPLYPPGNNYQDGDGDDDDDDDGGGGGGGGGGDEATTENSASLANKPSATPAHKRTKRHSVSQHRVDHPPLENIDWVECTASLASLDKPFFIQSTLSQQ